MLQKSAKIGQILKALGLLSGTKLVRALDQQKIHGGLLGQILVDQGAIQENDLLRALHEQYKVPIFQCDGTTFDPRVLQLVSPQFAIEHLVLPVSVIEANGRKVLVVAMENPGNQKALQFLFQKTRLPIKPMLASRSLLYRVISEAYRKLAQAAAHPPTHL